MTTRGKSMSDKHAHHERNVNAALAELVASLKRAEYEGGSAARADLKVSGVYAAVSHLRTLLETRDTCTG
jgi:hypothetical protein